MPAIGKYEIARSLADRIARKLPPGWGTVTAVGTAGGRTCQNVLVGQQVTTGNYRKATRRELQSVWTIVRRFEADGLDVQLHTAGACIVIGGAA